MRPKSLSATALNTATLCLARYKAESIDYTPRIQNSSASLGTTVHDALENYVRVVYIKKAEKPDRQLLEMFYRAAWAQYMKTDYLTDPQFKEGQDMLDRWYNRTDLSTVEVLSCEIKNNFQLKTSIGIIPVNYIFDRADKITEGEYQVVDYKSSAWAITPDDLRSKLQARLYAVAMQLEYPDAKRIWVKFDMLRHDMVGTVFTVQENRETYKYIRALAEQIIASDGSEETLNPECRFCVRRQSCKTLHASTKAGGVGYVSNLEDDDLVELRTELQYKLNGLKQNLDDADRELLRRAEVKDLTEIEGHVSNAVIGISKTRTIDPSRVQNIVGPALFNKYGGLALTMGSFDKMLKDPAVSDQMKAQLKGMVYNSFGQPRIKTVERKKW